VDAATTKFRLPAPTFDTAKLCVGGEGPPEAALKNNPLCDKLKIGCWLVTVTMTGTRTGEPGKDPEIEMAPV
jgi:hypothetical protein